MQKTVFKEFYRNKNVSTSSLYVVVHAYNNTSRDMRHVSAAIREAAPYADILCPDIPAGLLSLADPDEIAADIRSEIDRLDAEAGYTNIVLVGHSLGALIVRRVYLLAYGLPPEESVGENLDAPDPSPWVDRVDRIIQLAAMSRGWSSNHQLSRLSALSYDLGVLILKPIQWLSRKTPIILSIRKGAPFLTRLRMDWVLMERSMLERINNEQEARHVTTIQLLGTVDDKVAPDDNIDPVAGSTFIYRDVPHSGHGDVVDFADTTAAVGDGSETTRGALRRQVFEEVLSATRDELKATSVSPSEEMLDTPDPTVTDVVFIVHGIRDLGYWTRKIARAIVHEISTSSLKGEIVLRTRSAGYGFFPIISFIQRARRMEKVEWLMDQYVEVRALYPSARVSFVGHSHGTYLLAAALREYRFCRFDNVVFAGSVVQRSYPWDTFHNKGQVRRLLNYVATGDWVVAFFPKAFQMIRWQDLGSAGHDGFDAASERGPNFFQIEYVKGGHGAAIQEENWDEVAKFVLDREGASVHAPLKAHKRNPWVKCIGYVAPLVPIALVVLAGLIGWWLYTRPTAAWSNELLLVIYGYLVIKGLSRL